MNSIMSLYSFYTFIYISSFSILSENKVTKSILLFHYSMFIDTSNQFICPIKVGYLCLWLVQVLMNAFKKEKFIDKIKKLYL